jgi:membrane protein YqaA with SNARE-associated domain
LLYSAGKYLYRTHEAFFETLLGGNVTTYAGQLFEHHAFVSVFLAAFTPLPDRVFAFLSGVFTLPAFVVASAFFLGRLIRVGIVAYFSYEYGDEAREYILKHTKWVSFIVLALIGVYIVVLASGIL